MKISMKGFDKTRTFALLLCVVAWTVAAYTLPNAQAHFADHVTGAFTGLLMHWWMNSKNRLSS